MNFQTTGACAPRSSIRQAPRGPPLNGALCVPSGPLRNAPVLRAERPQNWLAGKGTRRARFRNKTRHGLISAICHERASKAGTADLLTLRYEKGGEDCRNPLLINKNIPARTTSAAGVRWSVNPRGGLTERKAEYEQVGVRRNRTGIGSGYN